MSEPPRPRHLMDPANPRVRPTPGAREMSISTVQMWVMSVLAVTTILHLAFGVMFAAFTIGDRRAGAETGLILLAGAFSVLAVVAGRVIHRKPVMSVWLLLGVLPVVVALLVR